MYVLVLDYLDRYHLKKDHWIKGFGGYPIHLYQCMYYSFSLIVSLPCSRLMSVSNLRVDQRWESCQCFILPCQSWVGFLQVSNMACMKKQDWSWVIGKTLFI